MKGRSSFWHFCCPSSHWGAQPWARGGCENCHMTSLWAPCRLTYGWSCFWMTPESKDKSASSLISAVRRKSHKLHGMCCVTTQNKALLCLSFKSAMVLSISASCFCLLPSSTFSCISLMNLLGTDGYHLPLLAQAPVQKWGLCWAWLSPVAWNYSGTHLPACTGALSWENPFHHTCAFQGHKPCHQLCGNGYSKSQGCCAAVNAPTCPKGEP